jgi:hypothetical protein
VLKVRNLVVLVALTVTSSLLPLGVSMASDITPAGGKQALCPVMNGKINKDLHVDVDGKRVYVCCAHCIDKIKAEPKKYLERMEKDGVNPEKAP